MNILITSVGRRTQLLSYFKKELYGKGTLIATDASRLAPALYVADKYHIVPPVDDKSYVDYIIDICLKEKVSGVLSLIDPELSILSANISKFENHGIQVLVSPYGVCELFIDKYNVQDFCLKNGFKYPKTYDKLDDFKEAISNKEIEFPVFVKPKRGSASLYANKANSMDQAVFLFSSVPDMIIQEYLNGQEIGIDVYVDLISKQAVSVFMKEKIAMRAGETDKSKSIKSTKLLSIITDFVLKAGLIGPNDIDVFRIGDDYYISEVNPRFGGGYLHAYECGLNFPKYIINNLQGVRNATELDSYEEDTHLMKHDTVTLLKQQLK